MTDTAPLYKVLAPNGHSIHGGRLRWSLPTQAADGTWTPGDWHKVAGPLALCRNGLHLTDERGVWRDWIRWGATAWEAEADGERVGDMDDGGKVAVRRARLLRPLPDPPWWAAAKRFVAEDVPAVPWFRPDGDPDPAWRLFTADSWAAARGAAGGAAYDAPGGAPGGAARDAARGAAGGAAYDAAGDAARDAAWRAAYDVPWCAAYDAPYDAARDAALVVLVNHVCGDLAIAPAHREHAAARWRVWQKGYALLCELDGALVVYAAHPRP